MWIPAEHHRLARRGAASIAEAFDAYEREFRSITARARHRFIRRDWPGMHRDAAERLDVYGRAVAGVAAAVRTSLDASEKDPKVWATMKGAYAELIAGRPDIELARTFFNSASRRIFTTIGVNPQIEFLGPDLDDPADPPGEAEPVERTFPASRSLPGLIREIVESCGFEAPFEDLDADASEVARRIEVEAARAAADPLDAIDVIASVFYRNQGAYLVGRIWRGTRATPLALAIVHGRAGLVIDAALLHADDVSILFSFTRSYFHVEVSRPARLVAYLKGVMPRKPTAELYNAIGFNRHGKTELFRDLMAHIQHSTERFEIAPGERGMVMCVFTLPSFDIVFKVIRDRFAYPKTATRREVMQSYQLVFRHDRAGRLADVQEFEHLAFPRARFSDDVLDELAREAGQTASIGADVVELRHLYVERRMMPLNLFLREASPADARAAILDYGQAVKDLAATDIFPGDMLLKNFGVTRHGRVVFYDYDELCRVTDCHFRELPTASSPDEDFAAEPWFYVGPADIFPEEFLRFLGLQGEPLRAFLEFHADLLTSRYWTGMQSKHRAGELVDILPYRDSLRITRA
ncbi:Isocitrate dehydrogenase kinase/phosphatase [Aquisphaera giovannonii]|uniref:Isocitrate dehydrogenase kinase/phosphatase n=1 Tax=Aquisphaera giovannonii TaxID=406548 RepID=A0A5B9W9C4_9BACT|nr:bifunctional isocitrate dehydrogenase kinase/phosphatase [Aquisphaera giovannonii]QEH36671.1 Isocitrate dehydrogenase kinase/phosphatase [Aquisphaera giovannonii]